MKIASATLALFIITIPVLAGPAIDDPGPHAVGWKDVTFEDSIHGQGTIQGRLFYPTLSPGKNTAPDPNSGPYPLVGFQHGWFTVPSDYDLICTHAASFGFVVASTGTETGLLPDYNQFALDTRSFLAWVDAESADPQSWLYGMAWNGDWAAFGHSMGGGALSILIGAEPRVRTLIGLQSMSFGGPGIDNMQAFTGNAIQVAGNVDWIVPPSMVRSWYDASEKARRSVWFLVEGMGHLGCMDNPGGGDPLPPAEQARLHRRLVAGFLLAEVKGEEDWYHALLGEDMEVEPVERECRLIDPAFWAQESPYFSRHLTTGIGGLSNDTAGILASLLPGSTITPYGELGLDPLSFFVLAFSQLDATGIFELKLPVPIIGAGIPLYLQGGVLYSTGGGKLTRTVEVVLP
ncbi:MAG: alpha/beta hydrolase [Planctomycetota bacterium]|jgi:hypothetical protein